jgi:hypothetical protein
MLSLAHEMARLLVSWTTPPLLDAYGLADVDDLAAAPGLHVGVDGLRHHPHTLQVGVEDAIPLVLRNLLRRCSE